jgi:mono/diheme cytochrome c family protein
MVRRPPALLVLGLGLPVVLAVLAACGDDDTADSSLSAAAAHGKQLARTAGCSACHGVDGSGGIGPAWTGLLGRQVTLTDGSTLTADDAYIAESIRDPKAKVVAGFSVSMPDPRLDDADVADLVAYIVTLGATTGSSGG